MPNYRYKYQFIQALDAKIGRDLRSLVEGYLGPDPDALRFYRVCLGYFIRCGGDMPSVWLRSLRGERRQYEDAPGTTDALYLA
jgi:hypothetical protein